MLYLEMQRSIPLNTTRAVGSEVDPREICDDLQPRKTSTILFTSIMNILF